MRQNRIVRGPNLANWSFKKNGENGKETIFEEIFAENFSQLKTNVGPRQKAH